MGFKIIFVGSKTCRQLTGGINAFPGDIKGAKAKDIVDIMERHPEAFKIKTSYADMTREDLEILGPKLVKLYFPEKDALEDLEKRDHKMMDISGMTVKALHDYVKKHDLDIPGHQSMTKVALIDAIINATSEPSDEEIVE